MSELGVALRQLKQAPTLTLVGGQHPSALKCQRPGPITHVSAQSGRVG